MTITISSKPKCNLLLTIMHTLEVHHISVGTSARVEGPKSCGSSILGVISVYTVLGVRKSGVGAKAPLVLTPHYKSHKVMMDQWPRSQKRPNFLCLELIIVKLVGCGLIEAVSVHLPQPV